MLINTLLLGAGVLLALIGALLVASHVANSPGRYDRPSRMANLGMPTEPRISKMHLGIVLICAGGALLLTWVYRVNGAN